MTAKGKKLGAYVMVIAPEGFVFIEKPGRGRGYEFPGGHGEDDDESLAEVGERELFQETGVHVLPEKMRLIDERVFPTHTTGIFLAQISHLPKTLKKVGDDGEIVHVVRQRESASIRDKIFPPHRESFDKVLRMLNSSIRANK